METIIKQCFPGYRVALNTKYYLLFHGLMLVHQSKEKSKQIGNEAY